MPESDAKADFDILLPTSTDFEIEPSVAKIKQAAAKYPKSARLQFRLGVHGQDDEALRRAAALDTGNAAPMYYLAFNALSRDSMDEGLAVLTDANNRKNVTDYPLTYKGDSQAESLVSAVNSALDSKTYTAYRGTSRAVADCSLKLQKQGRTDEALEVLKQAKEMGWKLAEQENSTVLSLLVGVAVIAIAQGPEEQIYAEIGSKEGLAGIEAERERLDYLQAGARDYFVQANDKLVSRISKRTALISPVTIMMVAAEVVFVISAIWWSVLLLRSIRLAGEEFHLKASREFTPGRLVKWYVLAFLPVMGLLAVAAMLAARPVALLEYVTGASMLLPLAVLVKGNMVYRRAADVPSWKRASAADKREFQRRMMGVMGGAIIFLLILMLLIAGGTRAVTGSYPWDTQSVASKIRSEEPRYVKDLLAGKVKVPQKLIREVEQRRSAKPGSG